MIISQIYAFYWHGNELREQSMAIAKVAYGAAPWLEMKPALKKMVLLIILRAQRPLEVCETKKESLNRVNRFPFL